jgi:tetratricopeptide (TPR) repeat protein
MRGWWIALLVAGQAAAQTRVDAEAAEKRGDALGAAAIYMQIADGNPQDPRIAELLYNASVLFARGHQVGKAIVVRRRLIETAPHDVLAAKSLFSLGRDLQRIYDFEGAATAYERFVTLFPGERDAPLALSTAMFFRQGLGQNDAAIADGELYVKLFPAKAAAIAYRITEVIEAKKDAAATRRALESYLRNWSTKGDSATAINARARLAALLWQKSCPVAGIDQLCATANRVVARCGEARVPDYQMRARSGATEALEQFTVAARIGAATEPGPRYWLAMGKLVAADAAFEALLARGGGETEVRAAYQAVVALDEPFVRVAATARLGQVSALLAAKERLRIGCDTDKAARLEARAVDDYRRCVAFGTHSEWAQLCALELARLEPSQPVAKPTNDGWRAILEPAPPAADKARLAASDRAADHHALARLLLDEGAFAQALTEAQRALAIDDREPVHLEAAVALYELAPKSRLRRQLADYVCTQDDDPRLRTLRDFMRP